VLQNNLSSIQYYYLEPSSSSELEQTTLLDIEAAWRQSGALVFHYKSGIWVFGKGSDQEQILPSAATVKAEGLVEFHGEELAIKQQGALDPSNVWKLSRTLMTSASTLIGATSPPSSADSSIRSLQSANAKASYSNVAIGVTKENGTVSSPVKGDFTASEPMFAARDIQEYFISAVLAAISYHLCHDSGFVALNARTLVLPPADYFKSRPDDSEAPRGALYRERLWLITLDVHLTSLGALLIKAWPSIPFDLSWNLGPRQNSGLSNSLLDGTTLFLAPSGKVGRYCGPSILNVSGAMVDVVGTPVEKYSHGPLFQEQSMTRLKHQCFRWLANKGIKVDALESGGWFMVQVRPQLNSLGPIETDDDDDMWNHEEQLITIAWPALLCFTRISSQAVDTPISRLSRGHDPLSFAEGWFSARAAREAIMAKRRKERESVTAAVQAQAEMDAKNLASNNFSPAGLRRASIAGAVYPTPPDGVQPAIGATPSFDGNGSTPGHPHPQNIAVESENVVVPKGEPEDADGNPWDSGEAKRDQIISSGLDFNDNENDNLFGEMGSELFGENVDITDADFNFFDEPDPVENTEDNTINDGNSFEDMKEGATEHSAVGDNPPDNVESGADLDVVMIEADHEQDYGNEDGEVFADQAPQMVVRSNAEHDSSRSSKHPSKNKSPSPPLSPGLIFKKLSTIGLASKDIRESQSLGRATGSFGGVLFDQTLSLFSKKYGANGRFTYPSISKPSDQHSSRSLPKTGYLNKIRKRRSTVVNLLSQAFISPQQALVPELGNNDNPSGMESPSFSHTASPISDQDDTSTSTGDGPLVFSPGLKRKRGGDDTDDDEMTSSFQELKVDGTQFLQAPDPLDVLNHSLLDADPAAWSLASFLSSPEPRNLTGILSDSEYIAAAQVLADQAISQTLHIPLLTDKFVDNHMESGMDGHIVKNLVQKKLSHAAKSCFDRAIECTMATFIDIQDLQQNGLGNRLQSRPTPISRGPHTSELTKPNVIFNLPAPHLEIQRSESKLAVLPPAVPFWETLGLSPCKGSKDVSAICIYPDGGGVAESVDAFLEQIRNVYESNRMGSHERFSHGDLVDGHVPMDFGDSALLSVADHQAVLSRIKDTSSKVGALLAAGTISETNIVIYYVYDSESPELLVPICSAFHDLFEVYKESLADEKLPVSNELVFQLVPMKLIASKAFLVVPTPTEYTRLAMEVYDRCVDLNTGTSAPSIILEQPLPRAIDFKLTPNQSASPLQENSCMHVAYAQSLDDRWVTAAWTDNTGTRQMTVSYCLGRRNSPLTTTFANIAREIWETTLGIIAVQKVNWRILIAKSGVMDPPEIEFWQSLAFESHQSLAAKESNPQITLTLITVDTNPSLELLPPSLSIAPNVLAAQSSVYTTPVSTPQASIFSPEPGNVSTPARDSGPVNAPTPSDSNTELKIDADATLIDITDQTWGVILPHRLNNSRSLLEFNPTLISGYLIKRSGAAASDVPIVIEVNIVQSEVYPRMYDPLLREILGFYRGFATLARVRGCVNPVKDGRPWHIAAVEKGVQALYMLL
jgi:mediator of RNA polymerase II transcription subunit 13